MIINIGKLVKMSIKSNKYIDDDTGPNIEPCVTP